MPSRILITPQDDFAGIATLAQTVYGQNTALADSAYLEWKYFKNPYGAIAVVREEDGQIVGFTGYMAVPMKIDNLTLRCAIGADAMVHPKYRRRGIFVAMCRHAEKHPDFSIAMEYGTQSPRSPTIRGVTKYIGDHILIGNILVLRKYLLPVAALRYLWIYPKLTLTDLAKYAGSLAEWAFLVFCDNCSTLSKALHRADQCLEGERIEISEIAPLVFGDEFDKLWERSKGSFRIAVVRTKQYLNWRYGGPRASYVGLRADEKSELRGYCILSYTYKGKQKIAWLVDLLAETSQLATSLVREAMQRAKSDGAHLMTMWGNGIHQDLRGSLQLRKSLWKLALAIDCRDPEVPVDVATDISNWYLTVADTDDQM